MFSVGDHIIYGSSGVCRVEAIGPVNISGVSGNRLYYTLKPVFSKSSTVFTPVDNDKVVMRPLISKKQAKELVKRLRDVDVLWISNDKKREEIYKESMRKCDIEEWARMIKTLYLRQQQRLAEGKQATASDERYYKMAQDNLYGELSVVLGIEKAKMDDYIRGHFD
ncbi:MAG: CarD family transcriptional regulator [Lachnospiraceae bacterium]|nr:CarD family transcriptional regulator [Lachnospiraceae bacterium]